MSDSVLYRKEDGVAYITLNRPASLNAMNVDLRRRLGEVWADFDADDEVGVAILTGAGRAFCSGLDLREAARNLREVGSTGVPSRSAASTPDRGSRRRYSVFHSIKPVIGAVNGPAAGGGVSLAISCDIIICSPNAQFVMPMAARGLDGGSMVVQLARRIGIGWAMWLGYSAQRIDAETALRIGLVNEIVPQEDLMPYAQDMAERIMRNSQYSVRAMKEKLVKYLDAGYEAAMAYRGPEAIRLEESRHTSEGVISFNEKRRPHFDEV